MERTGIVNTLLSTVFEYLAMLREVGPQEGFYKELQTTEETGFRWKEQVQCSPFLTLNEGHRNGPCCR